MKKTSIIYFCFFWGFSYGGCKKSSYLDAIPNQSTVIPQTLSDYQALLDNDNFMNGGTLAGLTPSLGEAGSDDYYAPSSSISAFGNGVINLYTFSDDIWSVYWNDWAFGYRCVFYANSVLDGISKLQISANNKDIYNNEYGSALFYRANAYYHLAQVFEPCYDKNTASKDLGIPLKMTSDINEKLTRPSVQKTYEQIVNDLKTALPLLPITPLYKTRPSKPAAYGVLARVYLSMGDYANAFLYSDSCLQKANSLIDYNTISTTSSRPFTALNAEVIFSNIMINNLLVTGLAYVDSSIFSSYTSNDLRKPIFYNSLPAFKGSYNGNNFFFTGIAVDEMMLIHAEGNARGGNTSQAMADLNALLVKRFKTGTFTSYTASTSADALNQVLLERRKELVFRGIRWTDLRRLNKEGANISVTRIYNGQTYTLLPNSTHYSYLIPPDVMNLNPGMAQNPR
jgi:hypothetical protein